MDADGDFVIAWQESFYWQPPAEIYVRRYNAAGLPQGDSSRVNSTVIGDQQSPALAVDREGNFVVAWQSGPQDGNGWGIYAQRYAVIPSSKAIFSPLGIGDWVATRDAVGDNDHDDLLAQKTGVLKRDAG
jgi:hypothetical protein